jgi:electron transfer flavoprotein alpha/beta subunit
VTGILNYTKKVWGTYDEAALEQGVRLKEKLMAKGKQVTLTAVTVGNCPSRFFTDLFSVSFDKVVQIPTKRSLDFHPDHCRANIV